jgi:hypothetical protein
MNYFIYRIFVVAALTSAALLVLVGDITAAGHALHAPLSKTASQPEAGTSRR